MMDSLSLKRARTLQKACPKAIFFSNGPEMLICYRKEGSTLDMNC